MLIGHPALFTVRPFKFTLTPDRAWRINAQLGGARVRIRSCCAIVGERNEILARTWTECLFYQICCGPVGPPARYRKQFWRGNDGGMLFRFSQQGARVVYQDQLLDFEVLELPVSTAWYEDDLPAVDAAAWRAGKTW